MTGGSTCPKSTPSSARLNSSTRTINATEMAETMYTSWLAERLAWSRCPAPMDWAQTTAPPVARAAKMLMMSTLIRSTSATEDTAASPAEETIMISAIPTMTARNCSMIRGTISFFRDLLSNKSVTILSKRAC